MNLIIIILLHFILYSIPPILGSFFEKEIQIYLNYTYLGILFTLTQLLDSLYQVDLTSQFFLNAGDISYSALIFSTLYFIMSQPDPKVVRNLLHVMFVLGLFLFILFILFNRFLTDPNITNYLDISALFLEFSYKSLLYSFLLYSSETLLLIFLLKLFAKKIKNQLIISLIGWFVYFIVIILDGILYPLGINILFPGSQFSIQYGIFAKIIFGFGFGAIIVLLLNLRPQNFAAFVKENSPIRDYLISPQRRSLEKKLEQAHVEITKLREILPICAKCKKIRDDDGYWNQIEQYFTEHNEVLFSHSLCPDCSDEIMKEFDQQKK